MERKEDKICWAVDCIYIRLEEVVQLIGLSTIFPNSTQYWI